MPSYAVRGWYYSQDFEDTMMPEHTVPEIQRSSLASVGACLHLVCSRTTCCNVAVSVLQVVLTLKCLGINDVLNFDYIDPPEEFHLLEALRQLYFFDAITASGEVCPPVLDSKLRRS